MHAMRLIALKVIVMAVAVLSGCSANVSPTAREQPSTRPASKAASFSYAGKVVDEQGQAISGVEIVATHNAIDAESYGYIADVATDAHGQFVIERAVAMSVLPAAAVSAETIRLEFNHKDYAYARLEDMHLLSPEEATHLLVVLHPGRLVQGRAVDAIGQAVAGASVEITFGKHYELRRGTISDSSGRFEFHGLPWMSGKINVLTVESKQPMLTASANISSDADNAGDIIASGASRLK